MEVTAIIIAGLIFAAYILMLMAIGKKETPKP